MVDVAPPGVVFFVLGVADSRKKAVSAGIAICWTIMSAVPLAMISSVLAE